MKSFHIPILNNDLNIRLNFERMSKERRENIFAIIGINNWIFYNLLYGI